MAGKRDVNEGAEHDELVLNDFSRGMNESEKQKIRLQLRQSEGYIKGTFCSETLCAAPRVTFTPGDWTQWIIGGREKSESERSRRRSCNISVNVLNKELDVAVPGV